MLALFSFLPQMESFKAFGVEAKWRARLPEAEDILDKLRPIFQLGMPDGANIIHFILWDRRIRREVDTTSEAHLAASRPATLRWSLAVRTV